MAHEKNKSDPWHERPLHIRRDQIGTSRTDEQRAYSRPEIEKPDEIKERNPGFESDISGTWDWRHVLAYVMMKAFFCHGLASGMRLRVPASG